MHGSGLVMTYAELDRESARLARYLHEQGLRPGDGLLVVSTNNPWCLVAYWAAVRSGLYVTALNYHLSEREALAVAANCSPRALLASAECAPLAAALVRGQRSLEVNLSIDGEVPGCIDVTIALAETDHSPLADQPRGADMLYSSGTTGGVPKGIRPPLPDRQVYEAGDPMVASIRTPVRVRRGHRLLVAGAALPRWPAEVRDRRPLARRDGRRPRTVRRPACPRGDRPA